MTIVFGPSAADTSWEDARSKVRGDLWRPSASALPDDVVDRALHAAILEIEAERRWLWLETINGALTVSTDASSVAAGPSVKNIASLAYTRADDQADYEILDISPVAQVRAMARGTTPGWPSAYAFSNGQIYFDCTVPAASTFEVVFTAACPAAIEDAAASPPVTLTKQIQAVVALAAHHVALTYLKNGDEAARQRAAYERVLDRLMNEEDTARIDAMGGGIIPDTSYRMAAFGRGL